MTVAVNTLIWDPRALLLRLAFLVVLWPGTLLADGLMGRNVQFNVETWDDPNEPFLGSRDYVATVGPGPEFGLIREGRIGMDVVPVLIDVSRHRIRFSYAQNEPGAFAVANFNGYLVTFLTDCVLIEGASVEAKGTTLPMDDSNLIVKPQSLGINVSGLNYTPTDTITVVVDVADCPIS